MSTLPFDNYTVRPIETTDAAAYFTLIETNRPRLEDFFAGTVSRTKTLTDTDVFIADAVERRNARTYFPFIVTQGDEIAGFIDVKNIDWNIPKAELGCFIAKSHEGKGISSKALALVIEHLFTTYNFNKLFLRTHPTNASARALAEKCGFVVEGIIRRDYKTTKGELVDLVYYGLVPD